MIVTIDRLGHLGDGIGQGPDGPVFASGILPGDFIVSLDGRAVGSNDQLTRMVGDIPAGTKSEFKLIRAGAERKVGVKIEERDDKKVGDNSKLYPGLILIPADSELLSSIKGDGKKLSGLIVAAVIPKSPAAGMGLALGDQLTEVNGKKVGSLKEYYEALNASPGKLSFGSAGSGSSPHLAGEMMARQAGIQATHVPYKGAAPALTDLLGGQVQFMFDPGPGLRHAKEGKLKLLAVGSPRRASQVPDTPTMAEAGLPGFDADTIFGIYAPNGTPAAVITQLHDEINKALASPKVADVIKGIGGEVAALSRSEFIDRQNKDRERYGKFIKEIGLKVE